MTGGPWGTRSALQALPAFSAFQAIWTLLADWFVVAVPTRTLHNGRRRVRVSPHIGGSRMRSAFLVVFAAAALGVLSLAFHLSRWQLPDESTPPNGPGSPGTQSPQPGQLTWTFSRSPDGGAEPATSPTGRQN